VFLERRRTPITLSDEDSEQDPRDIGVDDWRTQPEGETLNSGGRIGADPGE
jgi:hypothetical protein|tara:strand:- start:138 stop:290 length:153 start_codon:yes stop_codon:yes gene_type:complete